MRGGYYEWKEKIQGVGLLKSEMRRVRIFGVRQGWRLEVGIGRF